MVKSTTTTHICRSSHSFRSLLIHSALSPHSRFSLSLGRLLVLLRNPQDYVTVYDGYTTRDPIILKFCGGGQAVPAAVSSGPELLVEFSTSPFGTFTGTSSQVLPLYGFQLEVSARWVLITPFCLFSSENSRWRFNSSTFRVPLTRKTRNPASSGFAEQVVASWRIPSTRWLPTPPACTICRALGSSRPSTTWVYPAGRAASRECINPCPGSRSGYPFWSSIWIRSSGRSMRPRWGLLECCRPRRIAAACYAFGMEPSGMLLFARIWIGGLYFLLVCYKCPLNIIIIL